jgi:hypothetical protein
VITLQDLFISKAPDEHTIATSPGGRLMLPLACTGLKPHFLDKMAANGVILPPTFFRTEAQAGRPTFGAASYGSSA